jgi:hypothetical protein
MSVKKANKKRYSNRKREIREKIEMTINSGKTIE